MKQETQAEWISVQRRQSKVPYKCPSGNSVLSRKAVWGGALKGFHRREKHKLFFKNISTEPEAFRMPASCQQRYNNKNNGLDLYRILHLTHYSVAPHNHKAMWVKCLAKGHNGSDWDGARFKPPTLRPLDKPLSGYIRLQANIDTHWYYS